MARCIALDIDCAEICRTAVAFMARGSEFAKRSAPCVPRSAKPVETNEPNIILNIAKPVSRHVGVLLKSTGEWQIKWVETLLIEGLYLK